jgi:serine acetyltransferase
MTDSLWQQFSADARFYRQLKRPDKPVTGIAAMTTALASKGWWMLAFHRIIAFSTSRRNLKSPRWWLTRILEIPAGYLNAVINKSEFRGDCEIPGPVYLSDRGYLMFGAKFIGTGTIIHDHVSAGYAVAKGKADRPSIGNNVWIGPNCIIAGDLHVGDGSTLLPGTVLTYSVAPGSVVRGSPAQIVKKDFDNTALRQTLAMAPEHLSRKS